MESIYSSIIFSTKCPCIFKHLSSLNWVSTLKIETQLWQYKLSTQQFEPVEGDQQSNLSLLDHWKLWVWWVENRHDQEAKSNGFKFISLWWIDDSCMCSWHVNWWSYVFLMFGKKLLDIWQSVYIQECEGRNE